MQKVNRIPLYLWRFLKARDHYEALLPKMYFGNGGTGPFEDGWLKNQMFKAQPNQNTLYSDQTGAA